MDPMRNINDLMEEYERNRRIHQETLRAIINSRHTGPPSAVPLTVNSQTETVPNDMCKNTKNEMEKAAEKAAAEKAETERAAAEKAETKKAAAEKAEAERAAAEKARAEKAAAEKSEAERAAAEKAEAERAAAEKAEAEKAAAEKARAEKAAAEKAEAEKAAAEKARAEKAAAEKAEAEKAAAEKAEAERAEKKAELDRKYNAEAIARMEEVAARNTQRQAQNRERQEQIARKEKLAEEKWIEETEEFKEAVFKNECSDIIDFFCECVVHEEIPTISLEAISESIPSVQLLQRIGHLLHKIYRLDIEDTNSPLYKSALSLENQAKKMQTKCFDLYHLEMKQLRKKAKMSNNVPKWLTNTSISSSSEESSDESSENDSSSIINESASSSSASDSYGHNKKRKFGSR